MGLIDQIALPLFVIWFLGLILVSFRGDIEFLWKITFIFIFVFYLFQFWPEINKSYIRLTEYYPGEIINWIYGIGKAAYFFLIIVWPVSLIRMFYSAANNLSKTIIITLISATMIFWIIFLIRMEYAEQIDLFIQTKLIQFFSF